MIHQHILFIHQASHEDILTLTLLKTSHVHVSLHFLHFPNVSCTFIISNGF